MDSLFVSIDYDDGEQDTYRAVTVDFNGDIKRFETGDPVKDYRDAMQFCNANREDVIGVMCSSSVDHFTMDGDNYKWIEQDGREYLEKNIVENNIVVTEVIWFTPMGQNSIGIVIGKDTVTGKLKGYIGTGLGLDQKADIQDILQFGAKFPVSLNVDDKGRLFLNYELLIKKNKNNQKGG